jgi:MFS transporter, DHA1 family, inner membrane transport protein
MFTLGMGLAGIPTGYLLSSLSRKSVVLLGLLIFSLATWLTAYAQGLTDLSTASYRALAKPCR